jgi:hypothetical protein
MGDAEQTSGGQFSTAFPKSDLEWTIYRAEQVLGVCVCVGLAKKENTKL